MSQTIIEIQGTKKGVEIQDHLEKIYSDIILETFGKRSIADTEEVESISCQACGFSKTYITWSVKYSGYRGFCVTCKHNWPES